MRILKILIVGAFLVLVAGTVTAQKFGVRTGINFSNISGSDFDTSVKSGLFMGVYKEMTLIKKIFYLQPELQYSQEGFSLKTQDVKIDYINVPVLAKVYLVKVLSFETGPQFGFPISDNLEDDMKTESFVSSWAFGMSLNFSFGLSVNGRYIGSLNEVISDIDGKGQGFQLGAAFQF